MGREDVYGRWRDSVHTEAFTIPHSWAEGATEMSVSATGTALDPNLTQIPKIEFRVRCVSIAWAPALAPVKHVPVVDVGSGSSDEFKKAGDISGKIILVHSVVLKTWDDLFAEYTNAPPVITAAVNGKARAVAFIATREHDILYRHTNSFAGEIDRIPQVLVAREDGERIGRLLASGHPVWADLEHPKSARRPNQSRKRGWLKLKVAKSPTSSLFSARISIPGNSARARSITVAMRCWSWMRCEQSKRAG